MKKFLLAFLILSLYFNLVPQLFPMNDILRFIHLVSFFPIALIVSKKLFKSGLELYGVKFFKGWYGLILVGFATGFISWAILYILSFVFNKYEYISMKSFTESGLILIVVLVGFGLGSLINDMIVRGLVFNSLKGKLPIYLIFILSILIYSFDDIWFAGFSVQNTIFSIALGLSLTYAIYKTNSIWMTTGIHWGLNVCYGVLFSVSNKVGDGIILFEVNKRAPILLDWMSTIISIMMFIFIYSYWRLSGGENSKN
ncbi:type II CAAX endopeptidase family protein [Bacillus sp. 31A1R]|uniref:Type II CAAX endopeptidase family protein n=1 Tax=Robertmurraya mangrovi TaxID=3098077 RepID=A0ABU5IWN5_9BACI|nr:type II CAAX endopeptidase family protein [Bacillus sp. 31A1R]MDZ5471563.1 type II CAAX endopeptidase family protein [Bacillus sp. 31A1R]